LKFTSVYKKINILPVLITLLIFSGFTNFEQKLLINPDGSGRIAIHYWTAISNFHSGNTGNLVFEENLVRTKFTSPSTKIEKIKIEDKQTDSAIHVYLELTFDDIRTLSEAKGFENIQTSWKETTDGIELRFILLRNISVSGDSVSRNIKSSYEFELPGEIVSTNGKRDGQKVTWEYSYDDFNKDFTMIVVSKKVKEKTCGIFGFIAAVIIIGLVYFTQRNKKKLTEK
jgi:hypothetical protein